ncbi:NAD-dependent protein deacetylase [Litchfieldella qijiaojingensis]|uniref:NAD-dependent protein deacetylase n=1 Tax=Litchfieldella qijiaojingensis TaxID=980347 RepID=A0ABQ2Z2F6_9GAMM|nr:NAD-dependent protein deacetylase [Halomonas qijiaojingensis]GGY02823.1 NAD-dependent protein deacetylase [Halomonas qijiaojingensis]
MQPDSKRLLAADQEALAAFVERHPRLMVLTGAGVSTESGIPDYRDDQGAWKRSPPMRHQEFMASPAARQRYWARALIGFRALSEARPGAAHRALARLETMGYVSAVVTQNVDGLHQQAGSRRVIDLHGRAEVVRCMTCQGRRMRHDLHAELEALNPDWLARSAAAGPDGDADLEAEDFSSFRVPACQRCGDGILKPDVVFFGDSVPAERITAALAALEAAEALLVVGSSLMVYSGYRFAREAARQGKPVACLNLGYTRADDLYALKVEASVGLTLNALVESLGRRKAADTAVSGSSSPAESR